MRKYLLEFTVKGREVEEDDFADIIWDILYEQPKTFEIMEIKVKREEG